MKFLRALSIHQWLKNFLLFIPATFASVAWDIKLLLQLSVAFLGFSLVASAVYLHNDITDKKFDQQHPEKKKRSIASGNISIQDARILQFSLIASGLSTLLLISLQSMLYGLLYLLTNFLYTQYLKQIPLVDILPIIVGYFIRLLIGASIANAPLSIWVLIMVGLLATYLVLMKRTGDVEIYRKKGVAHRKTVPFYAKMNLSFVTQLLIHTISIVFAAYIHFVFVQYLDDFSYLPYFTIPFAYIAILSYHTRALKEIQQDPISILLHNYWSLVLVGISFVLLIITLYPIL